MEQLLIVNPSRRRKSRKGGKRRSAAQRAATKRLVAMNRARRAGSSAPRRARRSRRRSAVVRSNPLPMFRRKARRSSRRRSARRSNPISMQSVLRSPLAALKPALLGAVGAIAVNTTISKAAPYIPAPLMAGRMKYVTQGAVALLLAAVAGKMRVVGAGTAAKMAEGALTVTLNDAIKDVAAGAGINLGGMGYYLPAPRASMPSASGNPAALALNGMGKYVTGPGAAPGNVLPMQRMNGLRGGGFAFGRSR